VIIFYDPEVVARKRLPTLSIEFITECFNHPNMLVVDQVQDLETVLAQSKGKYEVYLLMSSGNFGDIVPETLVKN